MRSVVPIIGVAAALLSCFSAQPAPAFCGTSDPALDATWQTVTGGWLAGDAAYSAPLPGHRGVWIFGDSLIAHGTSLHYVRNAALLRHGDGSLTTLPPSDTRFAPFAHPPDAAADGDWLWPSDVRWVDGRLWAFFSEIAPTGTEVWDFRFTGSWLARVDSTTLRVRSMRRVATGSDIIWGAATVVDARYLYVFGIHDHGGEKNLHIARVPRPEGLTGTWSYWNLHRWTRRPDPAAHALIGVSNQVSVLRVARGYVLITHDPALGSAVRAYRAARLTGPWRPANVLYHAVPPTAAGVTYNAQAHPELPGPGLVLTYNVMENPAGALPSDPATARPRFFRVPWGCLGGRARADPPPARAIAVAATNAAAGTIPSRPFGESRLAADRRGEAVVAWVQTPDPTRPGAAVYVSGRPAGGAFGAPERVSRPGQDARTIGLAVSPDGHAALAWRVASPAGTDRLVVARGSATTGFGRDQVIARGLPAVGWTGATDHPGDPLVTVADGGATLVAWLAPSGCGTVVKARRIGADGTRGRVRTLSHGCPHATTLRGAVDGHGDGIVAWRSGRRCAYAQPCHYAIQAAVIRRATPRRAVTVSRRPAAALGLAVAAGGGRGVVAWRDAAIVTRERTLGRVLAATLSGGRLGAPVAVSMADRIAGFPAAAAGPAGQLLVAWQAIDGPGAGVEVAQAGAGNAFGPPVTTGGRTSGTGYRTAPLASFDASGRATVAWMATDGGLTAATPQPDGTWRLLATGSGPGHAPALAGGAAGEMIGMWTGVSSLGQLDSLRWQLLLPAGR